MNEKNRHVSVPQPLPANFGPPVPPVGPGPGQVVGQQPWVGQPPWPPQQGFPPFKNNSSVREYPPTMHPSGYNIQRFPNYDQCQNFQFGKIHEGPTTYSAIRHYESHPFNNDVPKESPLPKSSIDLFPQNKSPGRAVQKEKNGHDEPPSSPSDSKSDSETNNTTTESCPDDTRSPMSCDKQDSFFVDKNGENSMKSISDSNSHLEADILHKKNRNNTDADAQTFSSSISNSNNHHAKKDNAMLHYEARFHNQPSYRHGESMFGSYPEGRMLNNIPPHELTDNVNFGYRHQRRNSLNDIEKLADGNFSDKRGTSENVFQVPSISSTTPPKIFPPIPHESWDDSKYYQQQDEDGDKVPRKKRKRCGECPGCLQKQNCGRCGPCRSVRSHQICKMRKCESLKTKKEKAAEESVKTGGGRRSKDLDHSRNSIDKVNGNSSSPAMIPTPRSHMDQYQPQGGSNYQPPVNSYNPPTQYGSFTPPQHMQMFDSRVPAVDSPVDLDSSNSAHQMANTRLKTLIHNRQNQREQLMPICNPLQEQPYSASVPLSPGSQSYRPPFLPPLNHQENSMRYSSSSESALIHLQQLSPNSISPQKSQNCVPWSEGGHKTPESIQTLTQKSPLKSSLQNGHATHEETKMVNGCHNKPDSSSVSNNCALDNNSSSSESSVTQNGHAVMKNSAVENESIKPDIKPFITPEKSLTPIENGASHLLPLAPRLQNSGFPSPSFAYRHVAPLHNFSPNIPQGCLPPPPMAQPVTPSENGERVTPLNSTTTPDANCSENTSTTQSPPFLLNTTTSMNTFISTTNTYNSKLSFSNATCLPTYASTSVSNSSHMYINSYNSHQMYFSSYSDHKPSLYPPGGGRPSKPCIDSGRIHSDMYTSDFVPDFGHYHQDLPPYPSSYTHPLSSSPPKITGGDDPAEKLERLRTNTKLDPPQCDCLRNKEVMPSEKMPYYTHLGSGASVSAIRELIECRSGEKGDAIRIEKLVCVGKEGRTSQGCPLAKWVIRRSGPGEKLLTVVRHRTGHSCPTAYIVVALVAWDGVPQSLADTLYSTVVQKTLHYGIPTQRKCATNEMRTCACQGLDPETCGASFSFGCSWSMYYNGCKFARSKNARKFKLTEKEEEQELEDKLQNLATDVSSLYRKIAPESFENQTAFETEASDCRLGRFSGRPFSGVTACIDYCAHAHKDLHNMNNGCTVVVTLTKHRGFDKPDSEQLHVLPLYTIDTTDEWGNSQEQKITSGALEVLDKYSTDFMVRTTPLKPCKTRGRKPKDGLSPRRMALQATFRQLIASGKLRRIDRGGETAMGNSNQNYNVSQQYSKFSYNSTYVCNDGNNNRLSTHVADDNNSNKRLYDDDDNFYHHDPYPSYDSTSFYRQYGYGSKASSLPFKIPGNCSASTMHAMQFSADKAFHPTSSHCGTYTIPKPANPYPVNHSNYNTNNNFVDTPPPAAYTKSPLKSSPYSELESDSVYALQDLDSKSINCFFKKEHEYADSPSNDQINNNNSHLQPKNQLCELNNNGSHFQSKYEFQPKYDLPPKSHLCEVDNSSHIQPKFDTQPKSHLCEVNNNNYLQPKSHHYELNNNSFQPPVYNYHHLAKNYNFHLQQSNTLFYPPPDHNKDGYEKQSVEEDDHMVDSTTLEGDEVYEGHSDNESCFRDPEVGGVAIALTHGSVLFECAKHELHATTAVRKPDRANPTRISLVFYQHKNLNRKGHGGEEWEQKKKPRVQGTGWTMFPMSPLAVGS